MVRTYYATFFRVHLFRLTYLKIFCSFLKKKDSDQQVAGTIYKMYEDCCNGDPTLARQMVIQANNAITLHSQFPVHVQKSEHDDDDDDEDMVDENTMEKNVSIQQQQQQQQSIQQNSTGSFNPADYINQPLFGKPVKKDYPTAPARQLGESAQPESSVEMDEDGFETVKKGNRRK